MLLNSLTKAALYYVNNIYLDAPSRNSIFHHLKSRAIILTVFSAIGLLLAANFRSARDHPTRLADGFLRGAGQAFAMNDLNIRQIPSQVR